MANWWDKKLTDKQKFRLQEPKDPSLLDVVSTVPNPVGDVASGLLAAQDVSKGNYGTAALNALGLLPFVPSMGATIKNVGKAAKTKFEVAHDVAQRRAALPISEGGLGLPANNTAMDRAKAIGFDVDNIMYHGTNKKFNEFKDWRTNKNRGGLEGIFFTDDKSLAKEYGRNVKDVYLKKGNVNSYDAEGKSFSDSKTQDFLSNAVRRLYGNSSVEMKNFVDSPNPWMNYETNPSTVVAVNMPSQIRSPNAAFDPFRRNDADILAGLAPLSVGSLLGLNTYNNMQETPKKEKKTK